MSPHRRRRRTPAAPRALAELGDVGVRRRHGEHGADAGDRRVELGGDQLGGRLEPPVALVADVGRGARGAPAMPVARRVMPAISDTTLMKRTPRYRHATARPQRISVSAEDRSAIPIVVRTRSGTSPRPPGFGRGLRGGGRGRRWAGRGPATRPVTPCSMASSWPEASRTGRRCPGRGGSGPSTAASRSVMSHDRNAFDSHTSFQPRNVASTSTWWRAIRSRRSVRLVGVAGGGDALHRPRSSTKTCGASSTRPGDGMAPAGVQQSDRGAVAVAHEDRPLDAQSPEQRRQHVVGLVVHVPDRPRLDHPGRCGRNRARE